MEDSGFYDLKGGKMAMKLDTTINDAVHGHLVIHEVSRLIIDTPEFQRLRNITQCGISNFVYPTANHTRFEHSLGVAHFAKKFVDCLDYQTCFDHPGEKGETTCSFCELKLSKKEKIIVEIAGLCHDLGHGPFSHSWEPFVREASGKKVKHENLSAQILKRIYSRLVENDEAKEIFAKYEISEKDFDFACDIINCREESKRSKGDLKQHLFEIIANESSGIDVDKMEYIIRDAKQFGMHFSMDVTRIMLNSRIIKLENGKTTIAYRDKIHGNIFDIFLTRAKMHFLCYQHPTVKRLETMLFDILLEADKSMEVNGLKLSRCHEDLDAYLTLDNSIFSQIQHSKIEELKNAQILIEKLLQRKLYTVLLEKVIDPKIKMIDNGKEIVDEILDELNKKPSTKGLNYRIALVSFKMGKSEQDPLRNVHFFNKDGELVDYKKMTKSLLSRFYPEGSLFVYKALYVYCMEDELVVKSKGEEKNLNYQEKVEQVVENSLKKLYG